MSNLDRIRLTAQRDANRTGETLAILNLNRYNPMYVIRGWNNRFEGDPQLVTVVYPDTIEDGAFH